METEVGNYFVSNYPPFSQWKPENVPDAVAALETKADRTPLGLYIHIPFCRKRCKFCYFKVYTDKNARQIEDYIAGLVAEMELLSRMAAIEGRDLRFVYFGGGTPSYLSARQVTSLAQRLKSLVSWDNSEEVTFECEPGTVTRSKLEAIRDFGVTRVSMGIENFDAKILELNGRAHNDKDTYRSYEMAREAGFDSINIDLIAGMVGETDENWDSCVQKALELDPDHVTVYQMELPHNTVFSREIQGEHPEMTLPGWDTKRRWVSDAFERFEAKGYRVVGATTLTKGESDHPFVYTDALWHGADMLCLGVASFGHIQGVHYQNNHSFDHYLAGLKAGNLPIQRALRLSSHQRFIREMILQLKTGRIELPYFEKKFDVDVTRTYGSVFQELAGQRLLEQRNGTIVLTRSGLLQVDGFLWKFFEEPFRKIRYS